MTLFEPKNNRHAESMSEDDLLERMDTRPAIMLACLNGTGTQPSAVMASWFQTQRVTGYSAMPSAFQQRNGLRAEW